MSRTARRAGIAVCILVSSIGLQRSRAVAIGDTRTISLHHVHTDEDLTITYKRNGQYDEDALKKINWILRDWRKNQAVTMDPKEIDLLWEVYQEVGATEPIYIICGYRSPATNEMLRNRSRHSGVARYSQHMLGKAIDFYIPGVPLDKLRAVAMKLQGGGVGYYPVSGSPFVHLDVGNVRAWPRMTREQLVKLFPDGRTVHIPADGTPLPGYQLALADLKRQHRDAAQPQKRTLLARLFNGDKDAEEIDDNNSARDTAAPARIVSGKSAPATQTVVAAAAPAQPASPAEPVPLPPRRPMYQIVAAFEPAPQPAAPAKPAATLQVASLSANSIINSRGFWDNASASEAPQLPALVNPTAQDLSAARRLLADSLRAAASRGDVLSTAAIDGNETAPQVALAYAAPAAAPMRMSKPIVSATITTTGSASIASKPEPISRPRLSPGTERLDNPWMRGLVLTASVQSSMVVTRVGDPNYSSLAEFMHKPESAVLMTFASDPHLGMTSDSFSGSAVVFPATVTFGPAPRQTAALQ
jgi:uncharacterized protein YcbK (DUF882 family)